METKICIILYLLLLNLYFVKPLEIITNIDPIICEASEVGTIVGNVSASGGNQPYSFNILNPLYATYVKIVNDDTDASSNLVLQNEIDRETIETINNVLIEVTDTDGTTVVSDAEFVQVFDANDNAPLFTNLPYSMTVYESPWWSSSASIEFSVSDSDDFASGNVNVTIPSFSPLILQSVNNNDYRLVVSPSAFLDYEDTPVITITLTATDYGEFAQCGPKISKSTETTVFLYIQDGPDQPPFFTNVYDMPINENEGPDTEVVTVTARDRDYTLNWNMMYSIIEDGVAENFFKINANSGAISLKQKIDREDDSFGNAGIVTFVVEATEIVPDDSPFDQSLGNFPYTVNTTVTIRINDVNDESPTFYSDETATEKLDNFEAYLDENTANSITIPGLSIFAQDKDQDENSFFTVEDDSDAFDIFPTTVNGEANLVLRVANSFLLDFEKTEKFTINIIARESSTDEKNSASATITVFLRDVNDNPPIFNSSVIEAKITENATIGDVVVQVQATDKDSGEFQNISYSLSSTNAFVIDAFTGEIKVNTKLDREERTNYPLTVTATDGGMSAGTASVSIDVKDENDNPPTFQRTSYSGTMEENSIKFTSELSLSATDLDEAGNLNSEIVFSIERGDLAHYFNITQDGPNTGQIIIPQPIDLEELDDSLLKCRDGAIETVLVVKVEDKGTPSLSSTVNVTIIIEDINDNTPVFEMQSYTNSINEKSPVGTKIIQVSAKDDDACSRNNEIRFQIDPDFNIANLNRFSMDSQTGWLTVRDSQLDRDVNETYTVRVLAVNGEKQAAVDVNVNLLDVNDKPPIFNNSNDFEISIFEDASVGESVWLAYGEDPDSNHDLNYLIYYTRCFDLFENEIVLRCVSPFNMTTLKQNNNTQVGNLELIMLLDRENISRYLVGITVEDLNADPNFGGQTSVRSLEVRIKDANDNAPSFQSISDNFAIDENSVNFFIGEITATDMDEGESGRILYSVREEDEMWVNIDIETGILTTSDIGFDREENGDWLNITVIATDNGSIPMSSSLDLHIKVNDVNDFYPEFDNVTYTAEIFENSTKDEYVLTVHANDEDTEENAQIVYDITGGFGLFKINSTTGDVFVQNELDREGRPDGITFTAIARDNSGLGSYLESQKTVHVGLIDINDNPPEFVMPYEVELSEEAEIGSEIIVAEAVDDDIGQNAEIVYSFVSEDENSTFKINSESGVITLARSVVNAESQYEVQLRATDKGFPPLNSTRFLTVKIIDTNNNNPVFVNLPEDNLQISEDIEPGTKIFQVNAIDEDRDRNAEIFYSIVDNELFSINDVNGNIYTDAIFDREDVDNYQIVVTARDNPSQSPRTTTGTINIVITDVDDCDPYYLEPAEQVIEIQEEEDPGDIVELVEQANDDDEDVNSINYYFIIGGTGFEIFNLKKSTRVLSFGEKLDRETEKSYDLVVVATSNPDYITPNDTFDWESDIRASNMLHVIISLTDINDNIPEFSRSDYKADIPYNSQGSTEGPTIQTVVATDKDESDTIGYSITSSFWHLNDIRVPVTDVFAIRLSRDELRGELYQIGPIEGDQDGYYEVVVTATDMVSNSATTTVTIGIIVADETVVIYSQLTTKEFTDVQESFKEELGNVLNAEVYIDGIDPFVLPEGEEMPLVEPKSVVSIHARQENSTDLVKKNVIVAELSQADGILVDYGIIDIDDEENNAVVDPGQMYLLGLIIVGAVLLVAIAIAIIVIVCMKRKYDRKLKVAEANSSAVHEMAGINKKTAAPAVPNTKVFPGGTNPLFDENQKDAIDLEGWFDNQESQDDDDPDDIDDNAVDNQDSAIGSNNPEKDDSIITDDGQDLDDGQFEIDFEKGDNARLVAALNAANQRRGGENLTYMFDQDEINQTDTAM